MSGEHHSPLKDKLHLPWKRRGDDGSSAASEQQPLFSSSPTGTPSKKKEQEYGSFADTNARVTRVWDVKMPPAKKTMVHGVLMPTMGGTFGSVLIQKRRRIAIEIHSDDTLEEAPSASLLRGDSLEHVHENDVLQPGEKVVVRILKPASKGGSTDESSEEGVPSLLCDL